MTERDGVYILFPWQSHPLAVCFLPPLPPAMAGLSPPPTPLSKEHERSPLILLSHLFFYTLLPVLFKQLSSLYVKWLMLIVNAKSHPWASLSYDYDLDQLGMVRAILCFLLDMWSQPPHRFELLNTQGNITHLEKKSYLLCSAYRTHIHHILEIWG